MADEEELIQDPDEEQNHYHVYFRKRWEFLGDCQAHVTTLSEAERIARSFVTDGLAGDGTFIEVGIGTTTDLLRARMYLRDHGWEAPKMRPKNPSTKKPAMRAIGKRSNQFRRNLESVI